MTHKSQLEDPLYKHWIKGGLASKYLKEGIEHMINNALLDIQTQFLSDICNHLSLTDAKCTDCTTANCIPCPTKNMCNITGKGRDKNCSYHLKGDPFKEYRKCRNDICDSLHKKILSQHRYGRPAWQNTDSTKWCTNHWEIAKCFLPGSGYADKISVEDTDCSGLLNLAINCLDVQTHLDLYLAPTKGIFSQILAFRNKLFHSASLSLTTEELEEHIDMMISVLQDKKELALDPQAQTAVLKLEQLKDEDFFISTKDEEKIRQESIVKFQQEVKDDYLGRKQELQDSLCRMYEEYFKTIPISPLLEDIEAEIDDVFVELVLYDESISVSEENSIQNSRKVENYKDIFYNDKNKCKNIYVIGDAGMGKSTWCMKMLRNWVSAQNNNKQRRNKEPDHNSSKPEGSIQLGIIDGQQTPEKVHLSTDDDEQQNKRKFDQGNSASDNPIQKKLKINNLNQKQNTKEHCINIDENVMAEFDIVLFVALRHAPEDGNITDMIRNQLFQEKTYLDDLTTEVLKTEAEKCLIIVDGLDEWTRPANIKCSSLLQHPSLPGRKGLNGCSILTTTRPWKLNNIILQSKDIDKTIKIQGIKEIGLLAKRLIHYKNNKNHLNEPFRERSFEMFENEVENAFHVEDNRFSSWEGDLPFLKVPLMLIFIVCSWYDNGHLESTKAGNFNGCISCLFYVAEKDEHSRNKGRLHDMEGIKRLKRKWSTSSKCLPKYLQENNQFSAYAQLLLHLGKLAFDFLYNSNYVCLVFTESEIRSKLTTKELEVAVKVGILSQSKVVGQTLTRLSSLSFLHRTIQEYLAAVYLCSSAEGHIEAIETYAHWYVRNNQLADNVREFVFNINLSTFNELCKQFAKYDVLSGNKLIQDMIEEWTIDIADEITSFRLYGAVLTCADQQSLEIKQSDFLHICRKIPNEEKNDDEIIDIENTLMWCPELSPIPTDQLRTVQLLRVNIKSANETELCKIDLSHCKHLEEVSFRQMNYVQIILNYASLTYIILVGINTSDIHVINTATSNESHVKQIKMINTRNSESCKLFLHAVFWEIDMLNVIECENLVIKIDPVMNTSVASRHVIHTVNCEMLDSFKMELGNELKIDTLILHSDIVARNINITNPSFANIPSSFVVKHELAVLPSESWCQIAQNISPTCIMLKSSPRNHTAVAKYIRNMKQLVKLHINIKDLKRGTLKLMRSLKSLPRLEDFGLVVHGGTEDIVAEYLGCLTQLKRLKLYLESVHLPGIQGHNIALSKSISKLINIEKLELKCTRICRDTCSIGEIMLHSLPYLSKLKHLHLHIGLHNKQLFKAVSMSLPKMVDIESLYLTNSICSLDEVPHSMTHLTKLKLLKCILRNDLEILALSKSVLTMTNLETLDITLDYWDKYDNETLFSLQGLPQLTHLKLEIELEQDDITALLISLPKLINLDTLSVELDCDNHSLNETFTELISLNGHLQRVVVKDSSITGYGVMASSLYFAKYCSSYNLPFEEYDYSNEHGDISEKLPYWELKRKQENK